jgi:A/G-specific adenine glycosylase
MSPKANRGPHVTRALRLWFKTHKRPLPWRKTRDPYKIWVSEIMLQQTTVGAVIPYYEKWLKLFPNIKSLAHAPLQKVLKAWQGLGYYERARNLHRAAKILAKKSCGKLPDRYEELRALPGFGPYTTAAVLSIAFGQSYPVIDANVRRVLMRIYGIRGEADAGHDKNLLGRLMPHFPKKYAGTFNQALMELGALICKPRNPLCLLCPVQSFCQAFDRGEQEIIPRPKKRTSHKIEAVVAIIRRDGKVLLQKRPSTGLLAGLWEFPGGKKKSGESLKAALAREIREELGADLGQARFLMKVRHSYTQFDVTLHAYEGILQGEPRLKKYLHRWVALRSLQNYPFPSGSAKIINALQEEQGLK